MHDMDYEQERLRQLHDLQILDTPAEASFDRLTALVADLLEVPIVLVSLADQDRQWFKSRVGLAVSQTPRRGSFCQYALIEGRLLLVEDTQRDPRFANHPLVNGAPHLRCYAGVPLSIDGTHLLGTLCVLDLKPRRFTARQLEHLQTLALQVEELLRLHARSLELDRESRRSRKRAARYEAIFHGAAAGIVRIDSSGRIVEINDFALQLLGYHREEVLGSNVSRLMPSHWARFHDRYLKNHLEDGSDQIVGKGRRVEALHRNGQRIPVHLAVSHAPYDEQGGRGDFIGILSDLSEIHETAHRLHKQQQLLSVLHRGLTDYRALLSGNTLWTFLKHALRELTGSDYALIGEVLHTEGSPALKIHALSDLSWNAESQQLMSQLRSGGMLLRNPDSLLGQVFVGGQTILCNDLASHPQHRLPPGHPPLRNYLGVPIVDQGEVLGMFAIANSAEPYREALVTWLEPFTSTCALLIKLYRQLKERAAFTEQLRQTRDEAEAASRAKSEFLSAMSHELRTPLNAILGFAQLLQCSQRHPLDERQRRQIEQIEKSGQHLLNLINEVLDLARIEAGKLNLNPEAVNLAELVREACETLTPIAHQHGVTLQHTGLEHFAVTLWADPTRLRQVLINLLSNAIKYNRPQGSVQIDAQQLGGCVHVSVRDTGIGIAAEDMPRLFQPFSRLETGNAAIEGTGVGLVLTRQILEQMGGRIGVTSRPGLGSEFWFKLPLGDTLRIPSSCTQPLCTRQARCKESCP